MALLIRLRDIGLKSRLDRVFQIFIRVFFVSFGNNVKDE